jgi:hypothetical protein
MLRNYFLSHILRILAVLAVTAVIVGSWGCAPSRRDQIETRLKAFKMILPERIRSDFESENYAVVVRQVDSLLAVDTAFNARWNEIKAAEAINLFSTEEVINYFVIYFVKYRERP